MSPGETKDNAGASGTVYGVTGSEGFDGSLVPNSLLAVTVNV